MDHTLSGSLDRLLASQSPKDLYYEYLNSYAGIRGELCLFRATPRHGELHLGGVD